jgi:hypothetical protein
MLPCRYRGTLLAINDMSRPWQRLGTGENAFAAVTAVLKVIQLGLTRRQSGDAHGLLVVGYCRP